MWNISKVETACGRLINEGLLFNWNKLTNYEKNINEADKMGFVYSYSMFNYDDIL